MPNNERESLATRLGFLFISAGCAIGLGNVWRFPYITGKYGGAAFVLIYLLFLIILGLPIMIMEFSVGRASKQSIGKSFQVLEPKGTKWHIHGYTGVMGNYLLMMFYTTVSGWMLAYCWYSLTGRLSGLDADGVGAFFGKTLQSPTTQLFWMALAIIVGFAVCYIGLRKGVERITKIMMGGLLFILIVLVVRSVTLPGAEAGISFYLKPDWNKLAENGIWESVFAALGQAFFTLSIGIGSMAIFGSYIDRKHSLTGESLNVLLLDTFVALMAGMIIFPACFAFGVEANSGPGLIFVTLPNIFNAMTAGTFWGFAFFIFMSFAAMTTIIAVLENIVASTMEIFNVSRKKSVICNTVVLLVLSAPCALGFNLLSGIQPLGAGSGILDLEDYIVSNNFLPLGSLVYLLFCTSRYGWGWENFVKEADAGKGLKFPKALCPYFTYILPIAILIIFVQGYINTFWK